MPVSNFGSARVIIDGKAIPIYGDVTVKHGDYIDPTTGQHYTTEKKQLIDGGDGDSALPLRKAFSPEITIPQQSKEGENDFDLSKTTINLQGEFGGKKYSITGGFIASDGLEKNSGTGEIANYTVTGGVYREL